MALQIPLDLLQKLAAQLQQQLHEPSLPLEEVEKILHGLLQSALVRMDLVSRQEFDAQCRVLERTRERLEKAEAVLQSLGGAGTPGQTHS